MARELDIELLWVVRCYRCCNEESFAAETRAKALVDAHEAGWRRSRKGMQLCRDCGRQVILRKGA